MTLEYDSDHDDNENSSQIHFLEISLYLNNLHTRPSYHFPINLIERNFDQMYYIHTKLGRIEWLN